MRSGSVTPWREFEPRRTSLSPLSRACRSQVIQVKVDRWEDCSKLGRTRRLLSWVCCREPGIDEIYAIFAMKPKAAGLGFSMIWPT